MAFVSFALRRYVIDRGSYARYDTDTYNTAASAGNAASADTWIYDHTDDPRDNDQYLRSDGYQIPPNEFVTSFIEASAVSYGTVNLNWELPLQSEIGETTVPTEGVLVYSSSGPPATIASGAVLVESSNVFSYEHTGLRQGKWAYYTLFVRYQSSLGVDFYEPVASVEVLVPYNYQSTLLLWERIPEYHRDLDTQIGEYIDPASDYAVKELGCLPVGGLVGPLFKFLSIFGFEMDRIRTTVDYLMISRDPAEANTEVLDALSSTLGLAVNSSSISVERLRALLDDLGYIRRAKGTLEGARLYGRAVSGSDIDVDSAAREIKIYAQRVNYITDPLDATGVVSSRPAHEAEVYLPLYSRGTYDVTTYVEGDESTYPSLIPNEEYVPGMYWTSASNSVFVSAESDLPGSPDKVDLITLRHGGGLVAKTQYGNPITYKLLDDGSVDPDYVDNNSYGSGNIRFIKEQADGKVYIGGYFGKFNGDTSLGKLVRLNSDGSRDTSFTPPVFGFPEEPVNGNASQIYIRDVEVQSDGKILVAGWFTEVDGNARRGIVRLNADGSVDTSFNVTPTRFYSFDLPGGGVLSYDGGTIRQIRQNSDGTLLLAGVFSSIDGHSTEGIAKTSADGVVDVSFTVSIDGNSTGNDTVLNFDVHDDTGRIAIYGGFTSVNSVSRTKLAVLESGGSLVTDFDADIDGFLYGDRSLQFQSTGKLLITGDITSVDGVAVRQSALLRLNLDGSLDSSFDTSQISDGATTARFEVRSDDHIYLNAAFESTTEVADPIIYRLFPDGSPFYDFKGLNLTNSATVIAYRDSTGEIQFSLYPDTFSSNLYQDYTTYSTSGTEYIPNGSGASVGINHILFQFSDPVPVLAGDTVSVSVHSAVGTSALVWGRLVDESGNVIGQSVGTTKANDAPAVEIPALDNVSAEDWTIGFVELLINLEAVSAYDLSYILIERNRLGNYFDGSDKRGGWISNPAGTSRTSDYNWSSEGENTGTAYESISVYSEDFQRTRSIIGYFFTQILPVTQYQYYTITSYNAIPGMNAIDAYLTGP